MGWGTRGAPGVPADVALVLPCQICQYKVAVIWPGNTNLIQSLLSQAKVLILHADWTIEVNSGLLD